MGRTRIALQCRRYLQTLRGSNPSTKSWFARMIVVTSKSRPQPNQDGVHADESTVRRTARMPRPRTLRELLRGGVCAGTRTMLGSHGESHGLRESNPHNTARYVQVRGIDRLRGHAAWSSRELAQPLARHALARWSTSSLDGTATRSHAARTRICLSARTGTRSRR